MKIKEDHRLYHDDDTPYPFVPSPNIGGVIEPSYLLMHYTAGSSAQSAIDWLTNPNPGSADRRVSAHIVIGRDGQITQLVPFNRMAWHAGFSYWEERRSMNRFSIGIEMDNDGALQRSNGSWVSKGGQTYSQAEVLVATHWKNFRENGWKLYPPVQYQTALELARLLVEHYRLVDVIGHEDVHVAKVDPGPAFPMQEFREELYGRKDAIITRYQTRRPARLYLDQGGLPPSLPPRMSISPLPSGTSVRTLKTVTSFKVEVIEQPLKKAKKKQDGIKKGKKKINKISDQWSRVRVPGLMGSLLNITGWMKADLLSDGLVIKQAEIYKDVGVVPGPEPPRHPQEYLPEAHPVRILEIQGDLVMVGTLQPLPRYKYIQGWIYLADVIQV